MGVQAYIGRLAIILNNWRGFFVLEMAVLWTVAILRVVLVSKILIVTPLGGWVWSMIYTVHAIFRWWPGWWLWDDLNLDLGLDSFALVSVFIFFLILAKRSQIDTSGWSWPRVLSLRLKLLAWANTREHFEPLISIRGSRMQRLDVVFGILKFLRWVALTRRGFTDRRNVLV